MDPNSKGRRRYQRGSLILKGSREKVWYVRWLEDVIENGVLRRVHRSNRVGTIEQFPTKMDAWREAEQFVAKVNDSEYRPRTILTFNDMATTWQKNVMVLHKPASQASEKGHISFHLVPFFGKLLLTEIRSETVQDSSAQANSLPSRFAMSSIHSGSSGKVPRFGDTSNIIPWRMSRSRDCWPTPNRFTQSNRCGRLFNPLESLTKRCFGYSLKLVCAEERLAAYALMMSISMTE